jgi:hypothetical protein
MPHFRLQRSIIEFSVCLAMVSLAACKLDDSVGLTSYLLRSNDLDIPAASTRMLHRLASQLEAGGELEGQFPALGNVATLPNPTEPGVDLLQCVPGELDNPVEAACLLLNSQGDFLRVQPVTWQSAAFYMYRIYVLPRSIFARVDPTKDFVAIDVFLLQEPGLWQTVAEAILAASDDLGARPYRP